MRGMAAGKDPGKETLALGAPAWRQNRGLPPEAPLGRTEGKLQES